MRVAAITVRSLTWRLDGRGAARGRTERPAMLVELKTATGAVGLGEAAPLPGMSRDTIEEVRRDLTAFATRAAFDVEEFVAIREICAGIASAAARFAIETALASALAADRGISLAQLLVDAPASALPVAAVVDDAEDARRCVAIGIRCLKIKAGADGDLDRIRTIAAAAPTARLRVDANGAWPVESVGERLAALGALGCVDYVEEPCRDSVALLADELACRIALDESIAAQSPLRLQKALGSRSLAALVLKPTLLGGLRACLDLAARARAAGVAPIVSHALEGPIGTAACAELALAIGGDQAVGLARHAALSAWQVEVPQLAAERVRRPDSPHRGLGLGDLVSVTRSLGDRSVTDDIGTAPIPTTPASAIEVDRGRLSITAAAIEVPDRDAIATADTSLSFRRAATAASLLSSATRGRGAIARARVVLATPEVETVAAIHAALDGDWPIALIHHRLPADEQERQRAVVRDARLPPDTAVVLFTSGSTGPARGVALSRAALVAAADANAEHLGWRDDDRWLCALSLAHAGGLAIVVRCLAARKPLLLLDRDFDPASVATLLEQATIASLVPAQLGALLDDAAWRPPAALRAVLLGGAPATPALLAAANARGIPFLVTYGMTETLGQIATVHPARAGDANAPMLLLPDVAIAAGTRDAPAQIRVRGPMLATAYLDGAAIEPELATADVGYLDGRTLVVVGRADDVIVSGGEKVHPSVVELVLAATPGVRAACAFGIEDARWGQIVGAALVVAPGFDLAAATVRWVAALPTHARPRELAVVAELPCLSTGKLDRRAAAQLPRQPVRYP